MLTTKQVADLLKVAPKTVAEWARQGKLPAMQLPGGSDWRFRPEDIQPYLDPNKNQKLRKAKPAMEGTK